MGKGRNRSNGQGEEFASIEFCGAGELDKEDKLGTLAKAIEDFENFFLTERKGGLYRFLMEAIEKPLIESVLHRTDGNQLKSAKILGINRNTLHAKIKKLKIDIRDFKDSKGWRR